MSSSIIVSGTPHVRSKESIQSIMRDVVIALIPASVMGIYYFGIKALMLIIVSIVSSVVFEWGYEKILKKPVTISDFSAILTGLLLALNLPATASWWVPVVGSFIAIVIAKQFYGGLGQNFINPALIGRAFLVAAYPTQTTGAAFATGRMVTDAATYATPLAELKAGTAIVNADAIKNALIGNVGGTIGETCAIALIIGGIYLLVKHVISWRIPVVYIVVVFILTSLMRGNGFLGGVYEIFCGGLMLGAIFMATDYVTSPISAKGQVIFAIGCGVLTSLIRVYGGYPEGVSYSILIMNLAVPLIDRVTRPRIFGEVKAK
ncbi:RnfABCDGE type electron transport complex subunit D [Anaerotignum sp. MSJ-24]|uniref:RnfABCDGE type electron transport complex subunit D n=1 Tax=Anaerotignum sp. MSJ-24 TaxID=2841521 RepID=UPI001C0F9D69|nr:RnfABCDGE type electron transport complex subunit D [Anaerotignum sp. MSJ-24]MBU5464323.1 RnfABCDGE type electron transport complex subunit D [Anaerotignum sp. MSJ-24]